MVEIKERFVEEKAKPKIPVRKILFFSGIVVVIAVIVVLIFVFRAPEEEQTMNDTLSLMQEAVESDNIKLCKKIDNPGFKLDCMQYFKDYVLDQEKKRCRDGIDISCLIVDALESNDAEACKKIEDVNIVQDCLIVAAVNLNDESVCDEIGDETERKKCSGIVAEDTGVCDEIGDEANKNECYALTLNDVSYCEKIENNDLSDRCFGWLKRLNTMIDRNIYLEEI